MRVLVTGGAGFIGGHVCSALNFNGHEPIVFDHLRERQPDAWTPDAGRWETILGDVRDPVAVTEAAAHVDGIIHLAAVLGTQETIQDPRPAVMTNIEAGLNVFEAASRYELPVVNICVGNWWMANPYSSSKHCVEKLGQMYIADRGLRLVNVRCVNAYGPRQKAAPPFASGRVRKIMPAFILRALCGMPVEVYGDGEQISDCVYVGDVADTLVAALVKAASDDPLTTATVEVGPMESHTVNQVAKLVVEQAESCSEIVHLPMRPGEIAGATVSADTSLLGNIDVDPKQFIRLEWGVKNTINWFRENEGVTWQRP